MNIKNTLLDFKTIESILNLSSIKEVNDTFFIKCVINKNEEPFLYQKLKERENEKVFEFDVLKKDLNKFEHYVVRAKNKEEAKLKLNKKLQENYYRKMKGETK